ncbi:hypothetical protein P3S67_029621 [Capsicum chacoense]
MILDLLANVISFVLVCLFKPHLQVQRSPKKQIIVHMQKKKKRKAVMQLRRRETYRLRKTPLKIILLPSQRQAGLTIQEPTLPEKAFAYQICVNKPEDNLAKGKQICGPLTIYATGMPTLHITFSTMT